MTNGLSKRTRTRAAVPLSASFDKRLLGYTLAAGAGLAFVGQPAQAASIFYDTIVLPDNDTYELDINSDGLNDVAFTLSTNTGWNDAVLTAGANGLVVSSSTGWNGRYASNLQPSQSVSSGQVFNTFALLASTWSGDVFYGNFFSPQPAHLGVAFLDQGNNLLYGFVRLDIESIAQNDLNATITAYGYEKSGAPMHIPGEEIPEPASLSLMALGSVGLLAWRRRKQSKKT